MNKYSIILISVVFFGGHLVMANPLSFGTGQVRLIKDLDNIVEYPMSLYQSTVALAPHNNKLFVTRVISRLENGLVPESDIDSVRNEICSSAKIFDKGHTVKEAYDAAAQAIALLVAPANEADAVLVVLPTDAEKAKVAAAWAAAAAVVKTITDPGATQLDVQNAANAVQGLINARAPFAAIQAANLVQAAAQGLDAPAAATAATAAAIANPQNADKVFLAAVTLAGAAAAAAGDVIAGGGGPTILETMTTALFAADEANKIIVGIGDMRYYVEKANIILNGELSRLLSEGGAPATIQQGMPKAAAKIIAEGKHGMGYDEDKAKMMLAGAAVVGAITVDATLPANQRLAYILTEVARITAVPGLGNASELVAQIALEKTPGAMGFYKFQDTVVAIHPKELMGEPLGEVLGKLKSADYGTKKRIASYYFYEMVRVLKDTQGADIIWNNNSLYNFYVQLDGHLMALDFSTAKKDPEPNNLDSPEKIKERKAFLTNLVLPMFNILFPGTGKANAAPTSAHQIFLEVISPQGAPNWQETAANFTYDGFNGLGLVTDFLSEIPYLPGIDGAVNQLPGIARADHDSTQINPNGAGYLGRDGFATEAAVLRTLYDATTVSPFGRLDYPAIGANDASLCDTWTGN